MFQESINQSIPEYLINFDYFNRVLYAYGFKLIDRNEATELGLPEGSGLFSELFANMLEEIKINKYKEKDYKNAANMTSYEKKISFLNRYFVYKKIMEVNTEKVELELGEYNEAEVNRNAKATIVATQVAKEEEKGLKPKIRKLSKKLLLVPATEAVDEYQKPTIPPVVVEKVKKIRKEKSAVVKPLLVIEDEEPETQKPETQKPETQKPETQKPELQEPQNPGIVEKVKKTRVPKGKKPLLIIEDDEP